MTYRKLAGEDIDGLPEIKKESIQYIILSYVHFKVLSCYEMLLG